MTLDFIKRVNNIALCSMMANFSLYMYYRIDVQSFKKMYTRKIQAHAFTENSV